MTKFKFKFLVPVCLTLALMATGLTTLYVFIARHKLMSTADTVMLSLVIMLSLTGTIIGGVAFRHYLSDNTTNERIFDYVLPAILVIVTLLLINPLTKLSSVENLINNQVMTESQYQRLNNPPAGVNVSIRKRLANYPKQVLYSVKDMDSILSDGNDHVFIFFKVACPYCEAAHTFIDSLITKDISNRVHYVNVESEVGANLARKFGVTKPTTIVAYNSKTDTAKLQQMFKLNSQGVRENKPDAQGIHEIFNTLY